MSAVLHNILVIINNNKWLGSRASDRTRRCPDLSGRQCRTCPLTWPTTIGILPSSTPLSSPPPSTPTYSPPSRQTVSSLLSRASTRLITARPHLPLPRGTPPPTIRQTGATPCPPLCGCRPP